MTGFGAGGAPFASGRVTVEIRSLNHKHQDLRLRLPPELAEYGFFLEQAARSALGRGRYDLSVRLEGATVAAPEIDEQRLRGLFAALGRIRDEIAPGTSLSLEALLRVPDVVTQKAPDQEGMRQALVSAFEVAHGELKTMQAREGETLKRDLSARLEKVRSVSASIGESATDLVELGRQRLRERIEQLLTGSQTRLSEDRLEQEIALVADKSDITEELVRLESHFEQFAALLEANEPVGRRLDFLLQEISREVNTVGSKSQHSKTAHLVVEMKSEVERLREQVQNVD